MSFVEHPVSASEELFRVEGVRFRYREGAPWALRGVDFVLRRRRRIAFVGANGSGKTTTFFVLRDLFRRKRGASRFGARKSTPHLSSRRKSGRSSSEALGFSFKTPTTCSSPSRCSRT